MKIFAAFFNLLFSWMNLIQMFNYCWILGITGNVSIDENGDRYSDYSLLDLDPQQDKFVVSFSLFFSI